MPTTGFAEVILFTYTIGFPAILDDLVALTVRAEQLLYRVHILTTTSLMLWLLMLYSTILSTTLPETGTIITDDMSMNNRYFVLLISQIVVATMIYGCSSSGQEFDVGDYGEKIRKIDKDVLTKVQSKVLDHGDVTYNLDEEGNVIWLAMNISYETSMPEELFSLKHLYRLTLRNVDIIDIPEVDKFPALIEFYIIQPDFPSKIIVDERVQGISSFGITFSEVKKIVFGRNSSFKKLNISRNDNLVLDSTFYNLKPSLEKLIISYNSLGSLNFHEFADLQKVAIYDVPISDTSNIKKRFLEDSDVEVWTTVN